MMWLIGGLLALILLMMVSVCVKKVDKVSELMRNQCMDVFNMRQALGEFQSDNNYNLTEWGKELKVCILSLQADVLRNRTSPQVKKEIIHTKPVKRKKVRRPLSDEIKKKQSDKMKAMWKRKKEGKHPPRFSDQTATESLASGDRN